MTTQNHRTRSAIGATLLSASAVAFASVLVGCPSAGTGFGGGLSASCTTLAQQAADIAQDAFSNTADADFQCALFANQIATIDAGCFDSLPSVTGFSSAEFRDAAVQGQQAAGCS